MRILLLHDDHADERPVARALEDAGHEIRRCAPPGKPAFPCMGATASSGAPSHQCPLDGTVDVAVVVHDRPSTTLAAGEAGVVCALRDGLPLVVAGSAAPSPYTARADAIAGGLGDVAAACDRAVSRRLRALSQRISATVGTPATVTVEGDEVVVTLPADAPDPVAVRAHRATADLLPATRSIDVRRATGTA